MRFTSALRDLANTRPCQSPCPPFQARHASVKLRNYRIASGSWTPTRGLNHQAGFRKDIGFKCLADAQRSAAFPAGKKQAKVQLPACFIIIDVASVNSNLDSIGAAISAGATGILLTADNRTGGASLYDAGIKLKELIRGRALLLILNRTDIADAIDATGVALTADGVPTVVARRMLDRGDGVIASLVDSAEAAKAAAVEGANLIMLQNGAMASSSMSRGTHGCVSESIIISAKRQQGSDGGIPVIVSISSVEEAIASARAGADGALLDVASISGGNTSDQIQKILGAYMAGLQQESSITSKQNRGILEKGKQKGDGLKHFLDASKEALLETERAFLTKSLAFLEEAVPELEELSLLGDAIKQLDELFLLVVVGEFNSGKSSIINALLGNKYLSEGILPTTNEISVLKFSENGSQESYRNNDGFFTRKLPAELLKDINIVDTPGTNVIVDRQQRLTEEYVPRADLVLFCMSADRPFTESETTFLRYIRQWGKKVVFVVNKVDILRNDEEVQEVTQFVGDNATRLLSVERTQVLAVSARQALKAKLSIAREGMAGGILSSTDQESLEGNNEWEGSRFGVLEKFILNFLVGGSSAGESVRLKLQSPLYVAEALMAAASQQLQEDLEAAKQDLQSVESVSSQLHSFQKGMEQDSKAQQLECTKVIAGAIKRAEKLVDSTLQLSNLDGLSAYIFGSRSNSSSLPVSNAFKQDVVGPSSEQLEELVEEHTAWLENNCHAQLSNYRTFAEERSQQLGLTWDQLLGSSPSADSHESDAEERRRWRETRVVTKEGKGTSLEISKPESSVAVIKAFDPGAGAVVLEEEIRESVINTVGAALGAAGLGVASTFILPTTLEDLLAVAIGGVIAYAALLNLPLKRNDAKEKIERVALNFSQDLENKMKNELSEEVERCTKEINTFIQPLQRQSEKVVLQIEDLQRKHSELVDELGDLQQQVANVE